MSGPTGLFDLAAELLAACTDALAASPGGAPARAYVSNGPAALDCSQLTVHAQTIQEASTTLNIPLSELHRYRKQSVNTPLLVVTIARCHDVSQTGDPIPTSILTSHARTTMSDAWTIWNAIKTRVRTGTLFASGLADRDVALDASPVVPDQGGISGWQIFVRVQLDGFPA